MTGQIELSPAERVQAWIVKYGITMQTDFVPVSKSRQAKDSKTGWASGDKRHPWQPTLNWAVRLFKAGGIVPVVALDYTAGSGHCPAYKASVKELGGRDSVLRTEAIAWECEHGFAAFSTPGGQILRLNKSPILPELADILYSLAMNYSVLDHAAYESWANDLGYDPDSRSGEAVYRACLAQALALRSGLGDAAMAELQIAVEDM